VALVPPGGHGRYVTFTSRARTLALAVAGVAWAAGIMGMVLPTAGSQAAAITLCRTQTLVAAGGSYTVQNNELGSGAPECITTGGNGAFTVASSATHNVTSGAPGGYRSVYKGCHWGACTVWAAASRSGWPGCGPER